MTTGQQPGNISPANPDKGLFVFSCGRKGSGKSVVCRWWFDGYPYDRLIVDVTHDLTADLRRDGVEFAELRGGLDMPARLPAHQPGKPRTWVYQPDMGAPTALDDMDRVVGLALDRGPTLIWCDEFGEQSTGNRTPPNIKRALHHGRHDKLTLLIACPRPVDIAPLAISQADKVYAFYMANPADRDRVAANIGWAPREFEEINQELARLNAANPAAPYWHSMYDQPTNDLWIMPPLPVQRRGRRPIGDPAELAAAADLDEQADRIRQARAQQRALLGTGNEVRFPGVQARRPSLQPAKTRQRTIHATRSDTRLVRPGCPVGMVAAAPR